MEIQRFIKRLDRTNNVLSVDADFATKIFLSNTTKVLPETEINHVVNQGELYNTERQSSTKYRILGTVNTLFHNTLTNTTGSDSLETFESTRFRDRTDKGEGILLYNESLNRNLIEIDGWQGYQAPFVEGSLDNNDLIELNPKKKYFQMIMPEQSNWELMVAYPYSSDTTHFLVDGGLKIVDARQVQLGGRTMIALFTPVKHGLQAGDKVIIYNMNGIGASTGTTYNVKIIGLPDGTMTDYAFILDMTLDTTIVLYPVPTRMKKVFDGEESQYYLRIFKRITEINDYEIYPLTFSNSIYNDTQYQFVFNGGSGSTIDIDISGVRDNKNRPLSELYLTFIKTDPSRIFTNIKSGFEMPFYQTVQTDLGLDHALLGLSDIHRIHDGVNDPVLSHTPIENDVHEYNTLFYGDVVEYNRKLVIENILGEVHHRFNTDNRLLNQSISVSSIEVLPDVTINQFYGELPIGDDYGTIPITLHGLTGITSVQLSMGIRQEGYYYKPHHRIPIRNWSNYIEYASTGTTQQVIGSEIITVPMTINIPDYAEFVEGRYIWRDLMDIGFPYGIEGNVVNYPFLNNSHYIHQNYQLNLLRQDPFGKYQLYYSTYPKDPFGDKFFNDNYVANISPNVC